MLGINEWLGNADERVPAAAMETSAPQTSRAFKNKRDRPNAFLKALPDTHKKHLVRPNRCAPENPVNQIEGNVQTLSRRACFSGNIQTDNTRQVFLCAAAVTVDDRWSRRGLCRV